MPGTTFTVSSDSERVVVYPEGDHHSSAGVSVHSPTTSGSISSSIGSEGWTDLGGDDGIGPSDSASRLRQHASRRHTTEAPPPPTRRRSSRREHDPEREEPRHHSTHSRQHRSSRPHRSESRRLPSDESTSTLASADDYPYGGHHGPPPRGYPPSGYRHVPAPQTHGGYPPSMTSAHMDPFQGQALVHMPHSDPFGYPTQNPFAAGAPPPASNPFSPMGSTATSSYFSSEPHAPPMPHHHQRPPPPPRPMSMYTPNQTSYGSELYHAQTMPYPGYPVAFSQMPYMYPPSHTTSPPPIDDRAVGTTKELESLRELIRKHEEERVAREKAMIAKAEADAAAAEAKRVREEEDKRRKEEIAVASAKAKDAAEKAAEEKAKKAKDDSDKKLAEAQLAKDEAEKKKKELEEEIKKNKPHPDSSKSPIKFKDAVGRKFSFPWSICKTWRGMETLIKQAFAHVDVIGPHVIDGHYDLTGPDGEIILPQVWDTTVEPGWEVEMRMWPLPELEKPKEAAAALDPFAGMGLDQLMSGLDLGKPEKKKSKKDSGKKKSKSVSHVVDVPLTSGQAAAHAAAGGIVPPPLHGLPTSVLDLFPPGSLPGDDKKAGKTKSSSKGKKGQDLSPFAAWIAGGRPAKKDDEKLELVRRRSTSSSDRRIPQQQQQQQASCALM